jgi:hypothetical protein
MNINQMLIDKLETDSTAALALLRGTIHECDRILRNWSSEEPLPAEFYYTYGSALYDLGRLEEDFNPYLDASEERLENGLSHTDKDKHDETSNKLHLALAKVWLAKVITCF